MEGSNLIFHRLAIVPADPGIGIALPVIADRRAGRRPSDGQSVDARRGSRSTRASEQGLSPSRQLERTPQAPTTAHQDHKPDNRRRGQHGN